MVAAIFLNGLPLGMVWGLVILYLEGRRTSELLLVGLGAYLAFVPYGPVLFDRLIATTRVAGTAVFAIYVCDAVGYTGSIGIQLYKDLAQEQASRLEFFRGLTYFMSVTGVALVTAACIAILVRRRRIRG